MKTKYGYSLADWKNAKKEMREILIERAKICAMITNSELAEKVKTIYLEPDSYALADNLGRDTSDILKCWVDELKKIHVYWST